jgi:hypothetical protein
VVDTGFVVDPGHYRGLEQVLHIGCFTSGDPGSGSVIVSVLARVEKRGQGAQGCLGDLGVDGGLLAGLVPQDLQVEGVEQAGFEVGVQTGQDVPGQRDLVEQGGVGGFGGLDGEGVELGLGLLALVVELGEPAGDPGPHGGGGGVGGVG